MIGSTRVARQAGRSEAPSEAKARTGNGEEIAPRIVRAGLIQHGGEQAGGGEGAGHAEDRSQRSETEPVVKDEAQDVSGLRSDGDANPDFLGALLHREGDDAVGAQGAEQQRHPR